MWILTHTGKRFDIGRPSPEMVDIDDIAHSLAMICRYNGHCPVFYSVAEHSILVSKLVPDGYELWGLLHDAAEAYIGDLTRPIKDGVEDFKYIERRVLSAVAQRFGMYVPIPAEVESVDNGLLRYEAQEFFGAESVADWDFGPNPASIVSADIQSLSPEQAEAGFIERFEEILLIQAENGLTGESHG